MLNLGRRRRLPKTVRTPLLVRFRPLWAHKNTPEPVSKSQLRVTEQIGSLLRIDFSTEMEAIEYPSGCVAEEFGSKAGHQVNALDETSLHAGRAGTNYTMAPRLSLSAQPRN